MRYLLLILSVITAEPCLAQSARFWTYTVPDRIAMNGGQFLNPSRNPWVPTGYNDDIVTAAPLTDFSQMAGQGAKAVRISFGFLNNDDCAHKLFPVQTQKDYYNPTTSNAAQIGYLDPTKWSTVVAAVEEAAANGVWVDLAVSGGNCSFFNTQALLTQYYAMWAFVARTFRNTPHIFDYEVLSEPHPSGTNMFTGYIDDGSTACSSTSSPSGSPGKVMCVQSAGGNVFLYAGNPIAEPGNSIVAGGPIPPGVTIECDHNSTSSTCTSSPGPYTGGGIPDSMGHYTPLGSYLLTASTNFSTGTSAIMMSTADGFNPKGEFDNSAVRGLCGAAFAAIRSVDQQTIVSCSPAKAGNSRAIAGIAMPDQSNWAANFNFFELTDYIKQVGINPPPAPPMPPPLYLNYTGYPSTGVQPYPDYSDHKGTEPNVLCNYPLMGSSAAPLTQAFLSSILTNCPIAFSKQFAIPVYANQVGLATLTPNAIDYMDDTLGTIRGLNLGFFVWVFHKSGGANSIWDGVNPGSSGDEGAYYQTIPGQPWIPKDLADTTCRPIMWDNGATSICGDYIPKISSHF